MSNMNKVAKELKKAMTESDERKPKAYDTEATVARVDGNTLWVKFPGGETETPVRRTIDAKPGDVVMVRVANHRAWTGGNSTNPPTDDTRANQVGAAAKDSIDFVAALRDKDVTVRSITAATGYIDDLYSKNIHTDNIWAATGYIDDLTSKNITTDNIEASTGYIEDLTSKHITTDDLSAATGFIGDLEAGNITANNIVADHATVNNLDVTYAKIADLNAARGRIDNLEANEVVVNDTLKAANADIDYLKSDWISTDRLVLTGNNKNNYPPVQITETEFNVNKTAYWTKSGNNYIQCTEQSVYDEDTQYYVRQTVKSIIEAINTANTSDPQIVVSNDKLIAASMDVAELSAITADMGELTAGLIKKGNNFINLNTSPATMEFKNRDSWDNSSEGIQFDAQGHLNIKGKVTITAGSNVPTTQEVTDAINDINIGGRNLVLNTGTMPAGGTGGFRASGGSVSHIDISQPPAGGITGGIRVTNNTSSPAFIGFAQDSRKNTFIAGEKYTVSCWIRANTAMTHDVTLQPIWISGTQTARTVLPQVSLTTSWKKIYAEGLVLSGAQTDSYGCAYVYVDQVPVNGYFEVCGLKLEQGNKVTDWTPAPEDIQAELDAKKSVHTLISNSAGSTYANILAWTEEGRENSNWGIDTTKTPLTNVKIGDTCRIAYKVTDMNNAIVYAIGELTSKSATTVYLTMHGLDTTIIDGGNIITNSIGANQIAANSIGAKHLTISDSTNLATANEMYSSSLPTEMSSDFLPAISSGYLVKKVATQPYLMVCNYTPNNFKQNDELYYEFYAKGSSAGSIELGAYAYTGAPPTHTYSHQNYVAINLTTTEQFYSGTLKLSHSNWTTSTTQYLLGFNDPRSTKSQIHVRKVVIRKKSGGELIVDGTLTVGSFGSSAQNQILNSKISLGGKNLAMATGARMYPTSYNCAQIPICELLEAGVTYTFQMWGVTVNNTNTGTNWIKAYWGGGNNGLGEDKMPDSNGYYCTTFTVSSTAASRDPDSKHWYLSIYNSNEATARNFSVKKWKLERGNKPTDWSPCPADTQSGENLIRGTREMMNGGGAADTGTFRASGGTLSHTNFSSSSPPPVPELKGYITITNSGSSATNIGIAQDGIANKAVVGKHYVQSCWVSCNGTANNCEFYLQPWYTTASYLSGSRNIKLNSALWQYVEFSGVLTGTQQSSYSGGYAYGVSIPAGGMVHIAGLKVEEGTVGTGWTPAREEADASTYVTQINGTGIKVAPADKSGNDYLQITGNNIDIYRNNVSMVGIDDSTIRVGKTGAQRTVISATESEWYSSDNVKRVSITSGTGVLVGRSDKGHTKINDSGLYVYDASNTEIASLSSTLYLGSRAVGNKYTVIGSSGLYVRKQVDASNTKDYLTLTDAWCCIGDPSATRITFNSATNPYIYMNANGTQCFNADQNGVVIGNPSSGHSWVKSDGLHVWTGADSTASNQVAFFGATAKIGKTSKDYLEVTDSGVNFYDGANSRKYGAIYKSAYAYSMIVGAAKDAYTYGTLGLRGNDGICTLTAQKGTSSSNKWTTQTLADTYWNVAVGTYASSATNYPAILQLTASKLALYYNGQTDSDIKFSVVPSTGSIYIANGAWLYGKKADGNADLTMVGINSSNQMFFGYGSYNSSVGASYFDGNTVNIRSKGNVNITGVVYPSSNVRLKNNVSLQGANTSGAYKSLIYISTSNTVNLGSSDCATYVNGTSFRGSQAYSTSDLRLKHNISLLDKRSSELIMKLKPFEFEWTEEQKNFQHRGKYFGFGAQEVKQALSEVGYNPDSYNIVKKDPEGYYALGYEELIPHLIYVAQEQHKEIELLKAEIKAIKEAC